MKKVHRTPNGVDYPRVRKWVARHFNLRVDVRRNTNDFVFYFGGPTGKYYFLYPPTGAGVASRRGAIAIEPGKDIDWRYIICHELAHWSGDKNRLNRDTMYSVRWESVLQEEAISTLTAGHVFAHVGVGREKRVRGGALNSVEG